MLDTKVGTEEKMDPAEVAKIGFKAMEDGEADVVAGLKNKMQVVMSKILPSQVMAEQHRKMAEPGTAQKA
jgi:short-subunit dehydrogenase